VQALVDGVHEAINCATLAAEHQAQGAASVRGRVENILQEAQRAEQAVAATADSGRALDGLAAQLRGSLGQFRV
jgi:methyl-accepting chemotaxis protein